MSIYHASSQQLWAVEQLSIPIGAFLLPLLLLLIKPPLLLLLVLPLRCSGRGYPTFLTVAAWV